MALQRQLGLLPKRWTGPGSGYRTDIGFHGSAFQSVGLARRAGMRVKRSHFALAKEGSQLIRLGCRCHWL
jgi:hypothetical protein